MGPQPGTERVIRAVRWAVAVKIGGIAVNITGPTAVTWDLHHLELLNLTYTYARRAAAGFFIIGA